jgi:anti-anti-sigma regulatory factor
MDTVDAIRIENDPMDSGVVQLILGGRISIENIKDLHFAAEELLGRGQNVRVDCSKTTEMDLTAIQLMIALAVDLSKRTKECRVIGIPAHTAELMRHAGM